MPFRNFYFSSSTSPFQFARPPYQSPCVLRIAGCHCSDFCFSWQFSHFPQVGRSIVVRSLTCPSFCRSVAPKTDTDFRRQHQRKTFVRDTYLPTAFTIMHKRSTTKCQEANNGTAITYVSHSSLKATSLYSSSILGQTFSLWSIICLSYTRKQNEKKEFKGLLLSLM